MMFNKERLRKRELIKGRFSGGNLGWIMLEDLELFAAAYVKPIAKPLLKHTKLFELIEREGPFTIQQIKQETGWLVKEIAPVLHRLQEAFLIYEDQFDGEWDRGWHKFEDFFPDVDLNKYTRIEAVKILLQRFAFRIVCFDKAMAKSYFKFSDKDLKMVITELLTENIFIETDFGLMLVSDFNLLSSYQEKRVKSIYAMHRNDFLVKSNERILKEKFVHSYYDT